MNDDVLFERLASRDGPAAMDGAFEDRLYSILQQEVRRGRSLRPALLLAATLVLVLTITAAIAVGSGLIQFPRVTPWLVPTPSASPSPRATAAPTARMIEVRSDHTATLLRDGMVLVTGGAQPLSAPAEVASAELYDSGLGIWTATGDMVTPRYGHTATLLPDGTVLVVGGISGPTLPGSTLASAELYDPQSGTWTTTGEMDTSRFGHTATLLSDGRVLVAGGYDATGSGLSLASAELYDPATGIWTATGDMNEPSDGHTATLLLDGKVLVAGGNIDAFSAELYNPATGTWITTGGMIRPRYDHTATLLSDGRVLVVGGFGGGTLAELYDPSSATWTATSSTQSGPTGHTVTMLGDGTVLIAGGLTAVGNLLASAKVYDPDGGTWTATRNLVTARHGHTATLLGDGTVLMTGGQTFHTDFDAYGPTDAVELYEPASGS